MNDAMIHHILNDKLLIGRTEWCHLPQLNIPIIKAKIDTGAKTSALHAFDIQSYFINSTKHVKFKVHPVQANNVIVVECTAKVFDERLIMSSNGHKEMRYIINTQLQLGNHKWNIEISLSQRDPLTFRMLLGREALNHRVLIDTAHTCLQEKTKIKEVEKMYTQLEN